MSYVRPPAVAGSFYERDPQRLRDQIDRCLEPSREAARRPFIGAVVPHAGLMYSGGVAGWVYNSVELPSRFVILCPNHTGAGSPAAINRSGRWRTPFGEVEIDTPLADALMARAPLLEEDHAAHAREHSLEVQLPFLQSLVPSFRFVPICLALRSVAQCREVGEAIAAAITAEDETVAILASSDMNHYEDQETTLRKDGRAIEAVLELGPETLWERVRREDISMCGFIPVTTMLFAARELGASRAELLRHATSGDVNRDYGAVVGYASIVIS
jgi:AmmeMemoRadiSam system protein B